MLAVDLSPIGEELGPVVFQIILFFGVASLSIGVGIFFLLKRILSHFYPRVSKRRTFIISFIVSLISILFVYKLLAFMSFN